MKNELIGQIQSENTTVGVTGLCDVVPPMALRFAEIGFKAIGFGCCSNKSRNGRLLDRITFLIWRTMRVGQVN